MLSTLLNTARSTTTSLLNAQFSASAHFDQVTSHLTERNKLKKDDQLLQKIVNQRNLIKFVSDSKLSERSKSSLLAVRKKQRRITFSLKSSFNLTRKRSFQMTNLKKESSSKSKVKLDAISEQRRQENSIESLCR
jgi:hypothetical protein